MWNTPTNAELAKIPALYATEDVPVEEKVIQMHFFIGGSDWYACEYDQENQIFFGYAILNNDSFNSEWGYFSLKELSEIKVSFVEVDRDLHFTPTQAKDIEKIRIAREV